jgi:hypothetical protein
MMQTRFQTDFSDVRVHTSPSSATTLLGAVAYTRGNDIHFAEGHYQPHTRDGLALVAHELTHVAQQRQGVVLDATPAEGGGPAGGVAVEGGSPAAAAASAAASPAGAPIQAAYADPV